jgi:hypothetical protein
VVFVAVPPTGDVRVRSSGLDPSSHNGLRLAPQPHANEDDRETPIFGAQPQAYARATEEAPERARLLGVSWMRNQRVAEIEILPAGFVPSIGALTVYGRVAVTVDFTVPGPAPLREDAGEDAFERVYLKTLINYEQGRAWRRDANRARRAGTAEISGVGAVPDTSVFAGRRWAKLAIPETGFYRVTYERLRLLPEFEGVTGTPLDSLRMFTWPGFPVLPEDSYCDSCDFREVAISVVDGAAGNGTFDNNDDAIEFFAMGPSDWANLYDPTRPDTVYSP